MRHLRQVWHFVQVHFGMEKLKRDGDARLDNAYELVSLVFGYSGSAFRPLQVEKELAALVRDVRKLNPLRVLEIGTARGGTLFLWARLAQRNATIVSIDLPNGRFGGGYSSAKGTVFRRFAGKNQKVHLLRQDSHAKETFEMANQRFGGQPIDFLFIDADHTYEGAKRDWEMYSSMVRPGGIIAFHDVAGNYDDTQVKRLWDSIKPNFEHREYVANPGGQYGIGVLFK